MHAAGDLFQQLAELYSRMDRAYTRIADTLAFDCRNCSDSCCYQTFFHFSWIEYLYLLKGLSELPGAEKTKVMESCRENCGAGPSKRPCCGANREGLCLLYPHRPMICRLHGVAYRLTRPDGKLVRGPGCYRFESLTKPGLPAELDRTEFYAALADLEQHTRLRLAVTARLRMTVAQMLLTLSCLHSG